ncbi:MAG: LytR family transcriptional regulator [Anaerolineae bacterium]|nr:MAG: LytR family transcriptional regulator [Anaerolineae bacterium]
MSAPFAPAPRRHSPSRWLLLLGGVAFSLLLGLAAFVLARQFGYSRALTALTTPRPPGFTPQFPTGTPSPPSTGEMPASTPTQPPVPSLSLTPTPTLIPWDGKERVTVLVMGLDYRDWIAGQGRSRSDTMMLLSLDPVTKTAGMLSVPRDLWVNIPGYGHGKINTAHAIGGPTLAVKTVELVIGVPIHYYAVIDFQAFIAFIDELGGVKLDIPYEIEVDPLFDENKVLKPGVQTLPGDLALAYARNRSTGNGDFDRARRQQQVVLAIRDRILDFNLLPVLVKKAPTLYRQLADGITTNMSLDDMIRLAVLAASIPRENIRSGVIDTNYVAFGWSPDNLSILVPYPDRIRVLRDEIFATSGSLSPLTPGDDRERMLQEAARIAVLNGSSDPGKAERVAAELRAEGAQVVEVGAADGYYTASVLLMHVGRPYTLRYLVQRYGVQPHNLRFEYDPSAPYDLALILGDQ